ncbi:Aldehyde ferredoxin oxidoreductase [Alkaliphilus metalliredigens QYMF]|uniref:Aldehyde ferredoxin oxidoreductase n=1 Tax=Alkaliphilus metalliredigens (strain QYMF) TaxID=293826 RepID=A6TWZ6_ALKMQ|nr:aldehyde ferredoxin oxidoreductase family protein [Alkaliphilus metalliredigens]ABR50714.1 Aldehyde ferredoxin oxidoreductase [Alkaliphilus metalliredigens QYMF]
MYGYTGTILRINLKDKTVKKEALDLDLAKKFIGGRGLGEKILMDEIDPNIDALSPENKLIVVTGPLSGTPTPTGGRYMVVTKSPLTGTAASSNSGGRWGAELKFAGYDLIIVEDKSETPVYINIQDDVVTIKDAGHLWGKVVSQTTKMLNEELGDKVKVLTIGPGGEKLSRLAAIMNDLDRAAGRSGVGAVMGSKNLKAITVRGTNKVAIHDPAKLKEVVSRVNKQIRENGVTGQGLPTYGTAVLVNILNENGVFPTNNFQESVFAKAEDISGETLSDKYLVKRTGCYGCPIACGRHCKVDDLESGGPEYETIWGFGADCGISDLGAIIKANYWCNEMGIDTISTATTIAAAMELYQKGLIKDEELGGLSLEFGNADSIIEWTKRMGLREGLGDKMTDGSYRLCESYGAPEVSMSVKKQELPAYDPRGIQGQGLAYATSNRGGCHVRAYLISPEILGMPEKLDRFALEGKAQWVKIFQDLTAVIDSMGLCLFTSFATSLQDYTDLYNAVTGETHTADTLLAAGERIWNTEKLFNLSAGITPAEDTLPERLLKDAIPGGPSAGNVAQLDKLLPEYYAVRGWDTEGIPTEARLEQLQIGLGTTTA